MPDYNKIIAEDDATLKKMQQDASDKRDWRTVIIGLPIIRKLLAGEEVICPNFKINILPDDVLWNNRPKP